MEEGTDNAANLLDLRERLGNIIRDMQKKEETLVAPAIQEAILARRSVEDARMRLGVALALVNGQDPLGQK